MTAEMPHAREGTKPAAPPLTLRPMTRADLELFRGCFAKNSPRPRSLEIMTTKEVFDLTNAIKLDIVGEQKSTATRAQRPVQQAAQ